MTHILTLIAPPGSYRVNEALTDDLRRHAEQAGLTLGPPSWLAPDEACDMSVEAGEAAGLRLLVERPLSVAEVDFAVLPAENRKKRFLIADMDATIVVGETLDELAVHAGVGRAVAEVTARAMEGKIDFKDALRERVATLKGLDVAIIDKAIADLDFTHGAKTLVATMAEEGAKTMLVSGGFSQFTTHVAREVGFAAEQANQLEISDGKLTGRVVEPILDRQAKLAALQSLAKTNGLAPEDGLAVGDGANDLAMIEAAGMGAAYRGKPILRDAADIRIDYGDLTALLYFQGYKREMFVDG